MAISHDSSLAKLIEVIEVARARIDSSVCGDHDIMISEQLLNSLGRLSLSAIALSGRIGTAPVTTAAENFGLSKGEFPVSAECSSELEYFMTPSTIAAVEDIARDETLFKEALTDPLETLKKKNVEVPDNIKIAFSASPTEEVRFESRYLTWCAVKRRVVFILYTVRGGPVASYRDVWIGRQCEAP